MRLGVVEGAAWYAGSAEAVATVAKLLEAGSIQLRSQPPTGC
ncbi:MAG TPA: hypothetical protein VFA46_16280 [Actinomycetes bacterium]|nr:hypothetical protein [Actinomycetes bacterium]